MKRAIRKFVSILLAVMMVAGSLSALAAEGDGTGTDAGTGTEAGDREETGGGADDKDEPGGGTGGTEEEKPGGSTATPKVEVRNKQDLYILPSSDGDSVELTADTSGGLTDEPKWTVAPAGVVEIKQDEKDKNKCTVTKLSPGSAQVTVTVGKYSDTCAFEVSGVVISGETSVMEGRNITLKATGYGHAKTVTNWEWYSEDNRVARMDVNTGTLYGVKAGKTEVYCKNGSYTSNKLTVTVTSSMANAIKASLTDGKLLLSGVVSQMISSCRSLMGQDLAYVSSISVPTDQGTLYEDYVSPEDTGSGVPSAVRYYVSGDEARQIKNIIFVPKPGFTGQATISYTGATPSGESFTGTIVVEVTAQNGQGVSYTSMDGGAVAFKPSDFADYCRATQEGRGLKYVTFTLPDERCGTLYYNWSGDGIYGDKVDEVTKYYPNTSPRLENVAFVPAAGYEGTFEIGYTGCDASGATYHGSVRIIVEKNTTLPDAVEIRYTVAAGSKAAFSSGDFQDACRDSVGGTLSHVTFDKLPDTASGTLDAGGSRAAVGKPYYYQQKSPQIGDVSFTPAGGGGTGATIPFTGYNTAGRQFTGTVKIDVTAGTGGSAAGSGYLGGMEYYTTGEAVAFSAAQFESAVAGQLPDSILGVKLNPPGASKGSLCSGFSSPMHYSSFNAYTAHTLDEMSNVYFLPKAGYRGTVELDFTVMDRKGNTCDGTLSIRVEPPMVSGYFNDLNGMAWAVPAVDFLKRYEITNGTADGVFSPNQPMRRGDFVLMLSRTFRFEDAMGTPSFLDVEPGAYYAPAIASAESMRIVAVPPDGLFRPNAVVTRQEAAVLLYRCMKLNGVELPEGSAEDLESFSDRGEVASYAQEALGTLVRLGIFSGDGAGHLTPNAPLNRAQMAVILYRALT